MHAAVGMVRPPSTLGSVRVGEGAGAGAGGADALLVGVRAGWDEFAGEEGVAGVVAVGAGRFGVGSVSRGRFAGGVSTGREGGTLDDGSGAGRGRSDCSPLFPR